jgi:hypothetical protein
MEGVKAPGSLERQQSASTDSNAGSFIRYRFHYTTPFRLMSDFIDIYIQVLSGYEIKCYNDSISSSNLGQAKPDDDGLL